MRILWLLYSIATSAKFIKNMNINPCRNCMHFQLYGNDDISFNLARCDLFGEKNIISGEIKYEYADKCRESEHFCGNDGKYFEEDKYAELKIVKNKIFYILQIILFISCVVSGYFISVNHLLKI